MAPVCFFRTFVSLMVLFSVVTCGQADDSPTSALLETHPFQTNLVCKRAPGSFLKGQLFRLNGAQETLISTFTQGHVGNCELARRASRNGLVCVTAGSNYQAVRIETLEKVQSFGADFNACLSFTRQWTSLPVREGHVQFIPDQELSQMLRNVPRVTDATIDAALRSSDTMWYDEESLIFSYQDSFGNPTGPEGIRANRVAYDVGFHSDSPDIRKLIEYFDPMKFKYPFAIAAGGKDTSNVFVLNFWLPPRDAFGKVLPVSWWKNGSHWHWVFPVGTIIGEMLIMRDPVDPQQWFTFEIRSRVRELNQWRTNVFRPFVNAQELADAIKFARPEWQRSDLGPLVAHLENSQTLTPARLSSGLYEAAVPSISGYYDYLPATTDHALIKEFLLTRVFQSSMNQHWKSDGTKRTYAAATKASFHIVPNGFIGGMLENSEASCKRCHDQTSRPLGQLDDRIVLYGEVWGEDQIFTWHPFHMTADAFTVSDGSRIENPRMKQAGLLLNRQPRAGDSVYAELPRPYPAVYR